MSNLTECVPVANRYKRPAFMNGAALQAYLPAEDGVVEAFVQGYDYVYIDSSLLTEGPECWTEERIARVRKLCAVLKIEPILHGNFKAPLGSDVATLSRAGLEHAMREVDLAQALGGAPLIVHGGAIVEPRLVRESRKRGLGHLAKNLRELVGYAAERGVAIWLENLANYQRFHPFYYVCTALDEYSYVLENVPGLWMLLDVSHAHIADGEPVNVFEVLHTRIAALSLSDNRGDRDSHLPLGTGTVPYAELLHSIDSHQWQGIIGFETRGAELERSLTFLDELMRGVKHADVNQQSAS